MDAVTAILFVTVVTALFAVGGKIALHFHLPQPHVLAP